MAWEKNYIKGFAKERKFDNGWSIISLSLNLDQLTKLPVDKYGNIKIDVCQKREVWQYGDTHYVIENTFVPNNQNWWSWNSSSNSAQDDELPF